MAQIVNIFDQNIKSTTMRILYFLFRGEDSSSNSGRDWDRSVFDLDRFRNNGSSNWID